jgi:protein-tyrosine phosphatase
MRTTTLVDGAVNFRDLGGCVSRSGRPMRSGLVYRSGSMHAISASGLRTMRELGLRAAFDLRSNAERAGRPTILPGDGSVAYHVFDHDRKTGNLFRALGETGKSAEDGRALMIGIYRALPYDLAEPYRELMRRIAEEPLPLVFNCAAGKDRTGVAAALLLAALDVPRAHIIEDYLKTEHAFDAIVDMFVTGPRAPVVAMIDREIWEPIVRCDARYLEAMFAAIDAESGSLGGYFRDVLKLDEARIAALRARLLA